MKRWKWAAALVVAGFAGAAWATPGGVDANGCHKPKHGAAHCHTERARGSAGGGAESATMRDKRLARECRGRVNAGACLGYARP